MSGWPIVWQSDDAMVWSRSTVGSSVSDTARSQPRSSSQPPLAMGDFPRWVDREDVDSQAMFSAYLHYQYAVEKTYCEGETDWKPLWWGHLHFGVAQGGHVQLRGRRRSHHPPKPRGSQRSQVREASLQPLRTWGGWLPGPVVQSLLGEEVQRVEAADSMDGARAWNGDDLVPFAASLDAEDVALDMSLQPRHAVWMVFFDIKGVNISEGLSCDVPSEAELPSIDSGFVGRGQKHVVYELSAVLDPSLECSVCLHSCESAIAKTEFVVLQ